MRIAMIGQKRTGSREGGVEVVVGELARRMADLGHQVTCYDRMGEGAPSEPYEKDGYRIVPVKALDIKGLSALTSSFAATRAAIKDGADVIHYHAEGPCVPLRFARSAAPWHVTARLMAMTGTASSKGRLLCMRVLRNEDPSCK